MVKQDFFKKNILEDVEKSWKRFTLKSSQESISSSADFRSTGLERYRVGPALRSALHGVQSHHQGWPVDAILAQKSAHKIVTKIFNLAALSSEQHCAF